MKFSRDFFSKQFYRIKIVGLIPFLRDVYDVMKEKKKHSSGSSIKVIGDLSPMRTILYVHSGWAILNVGLLWFSRIPGLQCTLIEAEEFMKTPEISINFDILLFGYGYLLELAESLSYNDNVWVAIHDPLELYSEVPHWRTLSPYPSMIDRLRKVSHVLTISQEVRILLAQNGVESDTIPTASLLPARTSAEISGFPKDPVRIFTVGRVYRRKNFELFLELRSETRKLFGDAVEFSAKWDFEPLPEAEYIQMLDRTDIYLVTSFQEGGPIPAMDAMMRGAIVLSTPVGQMPEIIRNGYNGYICSDRSDFINRIKMLIQDRERLFTMKKNALESIQQVRSGQVIVAAITRALA